MNKKYIIFLITLFLLASCGKQETQNNEVTNEIPQIDAPTIETSNENTASDNQPDTPEETSQEDDSINTRPEEINIENEEEDAMDTPQASTKVIELTQTYVAPPGNETIDISMSLNWNTIENITVSPVWVENPISKKHISGFAENIQDTVAGMTLEEASEISIVAGASLTTWAFKKALKDM